jgi:serine/threonine protein kinase
MSLLEDGGVHEYKNIDEVPYVHLALLGKGNSGLVEKVQYKTTKEIFARKLIMVPKRKQAEQEAIFRNEIEVIRRLCTHQHFIQVLAAYRTKQHFGIILKPVADNGDLSEYLEVY